MVQEKLGIDFIFDTISEVRGLKIVRDLPELEHAVARAENTALMEILGVDLNSGGDDYDAVMREVYPALKALDRQRDEECAAARRGREARQSGANHNSFARTPTKTRFVRS